MRLGLVTGRVVATQRDPGLAGQKLLLVQPLDRAGQPSGRPSVMCDVAQAGPGDRVFFVTSREASLALSPSFAPVDAAVVGIVDAVHRPDEAVS